MAKQINKTVVIAEKTHSKLAFSASSRWITCTGSPAMINKANPNNDRRTNRPAAEGTVAHEVCDISLDNGTNPKLLLDKDFDTDGFSFKVDDAMVQSVNVYLSYIENITFLLNKFEVLSEVKLDLSHFQIQGLNGGTSDCVIVDYDDNVVHVIDFKYGKGIVVEPEHNTQLMCYGFATLERLKNELTSIDFSDWNVVLTIVQPRAFHPNGACRSWDISAKDLNTWAHHVMLPAARLTTQPNSTLVSSEKGCQWCEAAGICPELNRLTLETAQVGFDTPKDCNEVGVLTSVEKLNIITKTKLITIFLNAVSSQVSSEILQGSMDYASALNPVVFRY